MRFALKKVLQVLRKLKIPNYVYLIHFSGCESIYTVLWIKTKDCAAFIVKFLLLLLIPITCPGITI